MRIVKMHVCKMTTIPGSYMYRTQLNQTFDGVNLKTLETQN